MEVINEPKVFCSVKQDYINGIDCLLICDVADRMLKPTVLPEGVNWSESHRKVCVNCQYHNDLLGSKK